MPKYFYRCGICAHQFDVVHLMSETVSMCPECHAMDKLQRIPQIQNIVRKSNVGDLVEQSIQENRDILKNQEKDRMEDKS